MKLLFDFFPVVVFVIAFKTFDIFVATGVAIVAVFIQVLYYWLKNKRLEFMHIFSLVLILALGGLTLFLHDEMFIKWKPTILNWFLAALFFGSHFIGRRTMIEMMIGGQIQLKQPVWRRLSYMWISFFLFMGAINLWVAYNFDTNTWVNFKLFGMFGLMLIFIFIQALFLTRHIEEEPSH